MQARLHGDEKGQASRVPQHLSKTFTPKAYIWPFALTEMLNITLEPLYLLRRLMAPSSPGRCGGNHSRGWNQSSSISFSLYFLTNHVMQYETRWPFYFSF